MKLDKAIIGLFRKNAFLGSIIMQFPIVEDNNLQFPMGVNAKQISVNTKMIEKYELKQIVKMLAHESIHIFCKHVMRAKGKNPIIWNIAVDLITNKWCDELRFASIEGEVRFPLYCDKCNRVVISEYDVNESAEDIYNKIIKHKCFSEISDIGNYVKCEGFDKHELSDDLNSADEKRIDEIIRSAYHIAKIRGDLPNFITKYYENLVKSKVNWKIILSQFIDNLIINEYSWRRFNKKTFASGVLLPIEEKSEKIKVLISIDTSGSIEDDEYIDFISEVGNILKNFEVEGKVIMVDSEIKKVFDIDDKDNIIKQIKNRVGFGGTSHSPVYEYVEKLEEKPRVIINFTDGETELDKRFYNFEIPSIWVTTGNTNFIKEGFSHRIVKYERGKN